MPQPTAAAPTERNISTYSIGLVCSASFSPAESCAALPSSWKTCASLEKTGSRNFSNLAEPPRLGGQLSHPAEREQCENQQRHGHGVWTLVNMVFQLVAHARPAEESQIDQAEHVERGHQGGSVADEPQDAIGAAF